MDGPTDKPIIAESSTSESTRLDGVLSDIKDEIVRIPDYQRDSDQWDEQTKSLLVESVINNLSIPAFFFEVILDGGVERNEVIDGQQRLTTLNKYYNGEFALVVGDDAPYISPNSINYAGKKFDQLPPANSMSASAEILMRHSMRIARSFVGKIPTRQCPRF